MCTTTQVDLFAKPICFNFFLESSFNYSWPCTPYCFGQSQNSLQGTSSIILMNSNQRSSAETFLKQFSYSLTRSLWSDHYYINIIWRNNPLPVYSCPMRKI